MAEWHWEAHLSDGRTLEESSPLLTDGILSPWRKLEWLARESGLTILSAAQTDGETRMELEAQGHPLECGQGFHMRQRSDGVPVSTTALRFVCRLEPERRVWAIVHPATGQVWARQELPDDAQCPDPLAA